METDACHDDSFFFSPHFIKGWNTFVCSLCRSVNLPTWAKTQGEVKNHNHLPHGSFFLCVFECPHTNSSSASCPSSSSSLGFGSTRTRGILNYEQTMIHKFWNWEKAAEKKRWNKTKRKVRFSDFSSCVFSALTFHSAPYNYLWF